MQNYEDLNLEGLKDTCKKRGVETRKTDKKRDLVARLVEHDRAGDQKKAESRKRKQAETDQRSEAPKPLERVDLGPLLKLGLGNAGKKGSAATPPGPSPGPPPGPPPADERLFGYPPGRGPESALGESHTCGGHPSAPRFAVETRVCIQETEDVWIVKSSSRNDEGGWLYDLHREEIRDAEYGTIRRRQGTGKQRDRSFKVNDTVSYFKNGLESLAIVKKIHATAQPPFYEITILKPQVDERRLVAKKEESPEAEQKKRHKSEKPLEAKTVPPAKAVSPVTPVPPAKAVSPVTPVPPAKAVSPAKPDEEFSDDMMDCSE